MLSQIAPGRDGDALAYAARTYLPLVQVPPGGTWGSGSSAAYALAEAWLDQPLVTSEDPRVLIIRYLAACGPATVLDVQAWSGRTRLKDEVEKLRPDLRILRDEQGNELFDLPDMPLPPGDAPAPPHFVPEYDNLVLSHADRTRVIADADRSKVFLSAGRVRATFLLDGFVRGVWKIETVKRHATLVIEPFEVLTETEQAALAEEGERLLRFAEDRAETFDVRFTTP